MLMPSIFGENMFDEFFRDPFFDSRDMKKLEKKLYGRRGKNLMKTDIRETDNGFELDIDLPGFKKDDVSAELKNGYLTISAAKGLDKDEKDKEGRYIRRERYTGNCTRSFYIGEQVRQEDIKAKFEDGILKIAFPKQDQKKMEENRYIAIEG